MIQDKKNIQAISGLGKQFSDATILMHQAIARKAGLTGTDHKYLGILMENGPMTAGELAQRTGLTTGAVTGVIDRLEKKKLVKREYNKDDRRKILIEPNYENARKRLGGTSDELRIKMVNMISKLSVSEMEIVEKYMRSTIEVMNAFTEHLKNNIKKK